jgi:hypothetical protein
MGNDYGPRRLRARVVCASVCTDLRVMYGNSPAKGTSRWGLLSLAQFLGSAKSNNHSARYCVVMRHGQRRNRAALEISGSLARGPHRLRESNHVMIIAKIDQVRLLLVSPVSASDIDTSDGKVY